MSVRNSPSIAVSTGFLPVTVVLDGNIGAGKSYLLERCRMDPELREKILFVEEPLFGFQDCLELYYDDPDRWRFMRGARVGRW